MINIPIDEYSSVIQPYYDGGESSHEDYKYSLVKRYKASPSGCLRQGWDAFYVNAEAHSTAEIESDGLNIDISGFEKFRIFCMIPSGIRVRLYCNGELVIDKAASGKISFIDSERNQKHSVLKSVRYEFINDTDETAAVLLHYLGMFNKRREKRSAFTDEWEGFFSEEACCELFQENIIRKDELERLRAKIQYEPYKSRYERIKGTAADAMQNPPEEKIGRTIREHHRAPYNLTGASELAIIGQIEQNAEMLKMACRYALSLACCEYWCADVMETIPMVTWHHRSFDEAYAVKEISVVLSMAGGLLSRHGRNFLYQMIIMKGFPRMEADFMTMEYIYHCNQGIAFMCEYVLGLTTVVRQFPRYASRLDEAKRLLEEMRQNSFYSDGSYGEGGVYWDYIIRKYLVCAHYLARFENKGLREFAGDKLEKTAEFGLAMLGETGEFLTFNDSGQYERYSMLIPALLYQLTGREEWASLFHTCGTDEALELIISSTAELPEKEKSFMKEYSYFPDLGFIRVYRGGILFAGIAGPSNSTHSHGDKGSFIIHKNGIVITPDCSDTYDVADAVKLHSSAAHSLALPVADGRVTEQKQGDGYTAVTEKASYENGFFEWQCNTGGLWDSSLVKRSKRTVSSSEANEFLVTDEFEFTEPLHVEFRLNLYDENAVALQPVNWEPEQVHFAELYTRGGIKSYQKILRSKPMQSVCMITKITVL